MHYVHTALFDIYALSAYTQRMHSFDAQMRTIHDHLYANANIRVTEDLQLEVAKVIQTLTWMSAVGGVALLSENEVPLALEGDSETCRKVAKELRELFKSYNNQVRRYPRIEAVLKLDDKSLAYIVAALADLDMSDISRDWLGDALEVFRSTAAKRLGGQFFTDQKITQLAISLLNFNPAADDLVDICAGTGGFLIAAAREARRQNYTEGPNIIGIEVDSSLAHLANSTLTHLSNLEFEPVYNADSFRMPRLWPLQLRKKVVDDSHHCLATNPPFGQKITIKDVSILSRFSLGHVWSKQGGRWEQAKRVSPTPPDILFLEKNIQLAIPGSGRVAIVLPYQILSGPKLGYVREWLLRNTRIRAVVDLSEDAFQPWTGTKTALLVVERRETPLEVWEPEHYPVFMSVSTEIGHDRRGTPIVDATGRLVCDLPAIAHDWGRFQAGEVTFDSGKSFVVSAKEFTPENDLRINAAYYRPEHVNVIRDLDEAESDEFEVIPLGDLVERIFFPGRFKRNYVGRDGNGVRFLGGTNITQLLPTNEKYLSSQTRKLDDFLVEEGWILVTRSGSTGIVSSVPKAWSSWAISEHVIRIVPKEDGPVPPAYIEAFLRSDMGQALLSQGIFGSVINEISTEHLASIPVPVPKDRSLVTEVVDHLNRANLMREESIAAFHSANASFEELIGRKVQRVGRNSNGLLPSENVINERQEFFECEVVLKSVRPV